MPIAYQSTVDATIGLAARTVEVMTFVAFIVGTMLVCDAMFWLWADRRARTMRQPRASRSLVGIWCGLMLGYLLWFMAFPGESRHAHAWMPVWVLATVYVWHLLVLPISVICISLGTIARGLGRLWRRLRGPANVDRRVGIETLAQAMKSEETGGGAGLTRRQALGAAMLAAPPLFTVAGSIAGLRQLGAFRIRRIDVLLAQLPAALDGMTIAQVSDTHIGRFTRPGALQAVAEATNALKADLVLFAGDLIDLALVDLPAGIDFLRSLDPRSGFFICEGNHDLIENPDEFESRVRIAGLPLLLDESAIARVRGVDVQVLGMTWRHGDPGILGAMSRLIPQMRPDCFQILLAHHPHAFDPAADVGVPITISGHTHGGQLMLNEKLGAGPVMFRYWSGLYRKSNSTLVVGNGVGNWFPLRINAPAEIVHLTLRRA